MSELDALIKDLKRDPSFADEYDALGDEFSLIQTFIQMRKASGLTQAQLAERLKTHKGNLSRLESGRVSPTWATITKYADACGFGIKLTAKPK